MILNPNLLLRKYREAISVREMDLICRSERQEAGRGEEVEAGGQGKACVLEKYH